MKNFMSMAELCDYLGVSRSFCYKLSHNNILPKYCPGGKLIYFKKAEVDHWLEKNRIPSVAELEAEVDLEIFKKEKGRS